MQLGQIIGDYEIAEFIGSGGMGSVYRVRHLISDRVEAMKILLPDLQHEPELAERFIREIKIQASLSHPNIASLYNAQRLDNQLLMFMEFVEGTSLYERNQQGSIDVAQAQDYIGQVLSALAYAHDRGVIHRDIKPRNILLTPAGVVKLTDFGIATAAGDKHLTKTGAAIGSLLYMSPEQINGAHGDARSDLYATGIMLYELATGQRPFDGDSDYSIMAAHVNRMPPPPIEVKPDVPPRLSRAIMRALEKDPESRFQTAREFRAVLESGETSSIEVLPPIAPIDAETLDRTRKQLAAYIGPMARILVDRAAKRAKSVDELYTLLAPEIATVEDQRKFLAARKK